ncbi:SGNH/GDSL hydrolase family protein [Maioricimonas rarisocia]|uniref:SGNH/GDSL hydrolase family protein n=1 Tax=Maioricimonas rarisocia TaxID=2528026 RepID=UPI0018D243CA|nr:SGNH/GDSL hydrolase family protein [Maioricimonas rarisocia]
MPVRTRPTRLCYPLAHTSRLRRMLAIKLAAGADATSGASADATESASRYDDQWDDRAIAIGIHSCGHKLDDVRNRLRRVEPVTWLFAGDSLFSDGTGARDWRSVAGHFTNRIRWELRRFPDTVVTTALPGMLAHELRADFEARCLRFQPDVAFLFVGPLESAAGSARLPDYEQAMIDMIGQVRQSGGIPVLNTTPMPIDFADSRRVDHQVYTEATRGIAAEHDVPLIDHSQRWEWVESHIGSLRDWYDDDGRYPGEAGHMQLARAIFHELELLPQAESSEKQRSWVSA